MTSNPVDMEESESTCKPLNCPDHFHANDSMFSNEEHTGVSPGRLEEQQTASSGTNTSESALGPKPKVIENDHNNDPKDAGFGRIVRNFTPS